MDLHSSFEALSNVLEELNRNGRSVRRVEATAEQHGSVSATVDISASVSDFLSGDSPLSFSSSTALIDDAGPVVTFRLEELSSTLLPDVTGRYDDGNTGISISPNEIQTSDGELLIGLDVVVDVAVSDYSDSTITDNPCSMAVPAAGETTDTEREEIEYSSERIGSALDSVRTESVPAYEDTAYLRRLYELSETFDQMSDLIELDVSAETVRRYMIDAGIHSPGSNATSDRREAGGATDGSLETYAQPVRDTRTRSTQGSEDSNSVRADEPQPEIDRIEADCTESLPTRDLLTDGVGLPDEVTLRELVTIVLQARTVHEVHRHLDIDHERTRELLRQLNVLDLVVNRVSVETEQNVTFETVAERIREST